MTLGGEIATRCRNFVAADDYLAAEQAIAELSAVEGYQAQVGYLKGILNFKRGDYKTACEELGESLTLNENSFEAVELKEAMEGKLRILSVQEDVVGIADVAELIIARTPSSIGLLNICAKALAKAGRTTAAVDVWTRIAEMAPADATPLVAIAGAYLKAKAYSEAYIAAVAAFEREPSLRAITIAADSAAKGKDIENLSGAALKLSELDGNAALKYARLLPVPEYVTTVAEILVAADAESRDPEQVASIVALLVKVARNAEKAGDETAAAPPWALVLQLDPTHQKASSFVRRYISGSMKAGIAFVDAGDSAQAIPIFQKIVAFDPTNGTALRKLASALGRESSFAEEAKAWRSLARLTGDSDAWLRALRAARKCEPNEDQLSMFIDTRAHIEVDASVTEKGDSLARKLVKLALQRAGDDVDAAMFATVSAIKAWNPETPNFDKLLARLNSGLLRVLRSSEALDDDRTEAAEKLLVIDPANSRALQWLSRIYVKTRRFEAASAIYEKLIELNPEEQAYWDNLSRCRKALKKPSLSMDFASRQAELHPNGAADAYLGEAAAA